MRNIKYNFLFVIGLMLTLGLGDRFRRRQERYQKTEKYGNFNRQNNAGFISGKS